MVLIIFNGIKRSGNHGIINLMIKSNPNSVHINDVEYDLEKINKYKNIAITDRVVDRKYTGFKDSFLTIISIEDNFTKSSLGKTVYLVRNPYNNLASLYCTTGKSFEKMIYYKKLWKSMVNYIKDNNKYYILYDKFYRNEDYRKNVFKKLGIRYDPQYLCDKPGWAKSSFPQKITSWDNEFNRYLIYENDPLFREIVLDDRELELMCSNLNSIPPQKFNK